MCSSDLQNIPSEALFHLSTNQCAAHRRAIFDVIKQRLKDGKPVVCISTQLIEAGVDISMSCVIRALGGLDSIAQAAGRCNREGKLPQLGEVVVFRAEEGAPSGSLKQGQDITEEILKTDHAPAE